MNTPKTMSDEEAIGIVDRDRQHAHSYRIVYGVIDATSEELLTESMAARTYLAARLAAANRLAEAVENYNPFDQDSAESKDAALATYRSLT